ncbi:MAG TPA: Gfo/Idh/MocA family oxidoreductase [Verrucomicrobiae bacterium]|nr:Gfo/Idh/MocA family oxidoreductase [Verrucomicrobiae bacterium]
MQPELRLSRRNFIGATGAVGLVAPHVLTSGVFGANGKPGANGKLQIALIGCNGMGRGNLKNAAAHPDVVVVGACDVYRKRAEEVAELHKETCKVHTDFREVLARKDVDAVIIATPPHWHALVAIMACEAGKDLYLQKPMTLHLGESLAVRNAVKKHGRICQVGTQIHASENYRRVVELIRAGYLGKIGVARTFNVMNQGPEGVGHDPETKPPEGFDWDFWCGPAPFRPYNAILAKGSYEHGSWMDYSGGWTPGMAPHIIDLPIWAMDLKYPIEVSSSGGRFVVNDDGDAYDNHEVLWRYPNMTLTWMSSLTNSYGFDLHGIPVPKRRLGIYFHGVNGTMYANYGEHRIIPEGDALKDFILPEVVERKKAATEKGARLLYIGAELKPVPETIPPSPGHEVEWIECIKARKLPSCNPNYHLRIDVPIVLSLLSLRLRRSIRFNPETEEIVGDEDAAKKAVPTYRAPWKFPTQYLGA